MWKKQLREPVTRRTMASPADCSTSSVGRSITMLAALDLSSDLE
jgi:hypothetical protein